MEMEREKERERERERNRRREREKEREREMEREKREQEKEREGSGKETERDEIFPQGEQTAVAGPAGRGNLRRGYRIRTRYARRRTWGQRAAPCRTRTGGNDRNPS